MRSALLFIFVVTSSSSARAEEPAPQPPTNAPPVVVAKPEDPCAAKTFLPRAECPETGGRAVMIRIGRIGVEAVLGTLLGGLVGAGGAYIGMNVDLAGGRETGVGLGLGATLGVALGVAPGVWLGGAAMGGDGSFGWTLLGSAAGAGLSGALLAIDAKPGMLVLGAIIPVASSIAAYELSSHTKRRKMDPKPVTGRIVPTAGPGFVGAAGTW